MPPGALSCPMRAVQLSPCLACCFSDTLEDRKLMHLSSLWSRGIECVNEHFHILISISSLQLK